VTRDHARKKAIRARMDASGESYSTAARKLGADRTTGDPVAADEVIIARVSSTLASSGARIETRADWSSRWGLGHRSGPVGRLATFAAKAAVKRISPETDLASVRERLKGALFHPVGEGFVELAAGRYQIDYGGFAEMQFNGQRYRGAPGTPLQQARQDSREFPPAPLQLLWGLRDVTDARQVGHETVRGTPCQIIAARVGSAEFTVWIDDEHIRRVQSEEGGSTERIDLSLRKTIELWDFGAEDVSVDWTHLPSFRTAEHRTTSDR
jgi:hypothetical protein